MSDILEGEYVYIHRIYSVYEEISNLYKRTNGSAFELSSDKVQTEYDAFELIWKYIPIGPFDSLEEFKKVFKNAIGDPQNRVYLTYDLETNEVIGTVSIMHNYPEHKKAEIGMVFYSPIAQGTFANLEANLLLMEELFDRYNYNRVEWRCHSENKRSIACALKMGFTYEGTIRQDMICRGCEVRDTHIYSLLSTEWAATRALLEKKLYSNNQG
jgi:RimJ/RimL family protein N-acetyltransferase